MAVSVLIMMLLAVPMMFFGSDEATPREDVGDGNAPADPEDPAMPDLMDPPATPDDADADADDPADPLSPEEAEALTLAGNDTLVGTADQDTLRGYGGDDLIEGQSGNDRIEGDGAYRDAEGFTETSGKDTLNGGDGNDTLSGGNDDDVLNGGAGNDYLYEVDGQAYAVSDSGNDTLNGEDGRDTLLGGFGDDLLRGGAGNDELSGGSGLDTLFGGDGNDRLTDQFGTFDEGPPMSVMDGGAGNDTLYFSEGSTVTGGEGADRLFLEADANDGLVTQITDFEAGVDRLRIDVTVGPNNEGSLRLQDNASGDGADLFIGDDLIAQITGAQGLDLGDIVEPNITIKDSEGGTTFTDGDAGSVLRGNGSDQVINGAGGDDRIDVDFGSNVADGGDGDDTLVASGGEVFGPYIVQDTNDDFTIVETLYAFQELGMDTLSGGAGDDVFVVTNGAIMTGGAGADTFSLRHDLGVGSLADTDPDDGSIPYSEDTDLANFPPAEITDFEIGQDVLMLELRGLTPGGTPTPEQLDQISIAAWEDGTGADISLDGEVVARVTGGQDLTVADLELVFRNTDVLSA